MLETLEAIERREMRDMRETDETPDRFAMRAILRMAQCTLRLTGMSEHGDVPSLVV